MARSIHHESTAVPDMQHRSASSRFARSSPRCPFGTHTSGVTVLRTVREVPTYREYYFTRRPHHPLCGYKPVGLSVLRTVCVSLSCEDPEMHSVCGTSLRSLMNTSSHTYPLRSGSLKTRARAG
jgi:hypothetical protein